MTEAFERLDYTLITKPSAVDAHYVYTIEEEAARREIIALIDAEKRAYLERVEPLIKRLAAIVGTPRYIVRREP